LNVELENMNEAEAISFIKTLTEKTVVPELKN